MIDTDTDVVCDAGPIIHLDEISCLDLLGDFRATPLINAPSPARQSTKLSYLPYLRDIAAYP